tara:strand:- start:548 stop:1318 length:771 start_codon:yes stop_codon:yes gene_type:complete
MTLFQFKILSWYEKNRRELPWRRTKNPYYILVSEMMLQQTQVDRVIPKYEAWLQAFPSLKTLAIASKEEVLQLWSGLGYNNRALRLQQLAQLLKDKPFPQTEEELLALPGIGPYTARAILAFAFNKEVPVVDTNIRRVLIHELKLQENISEKELEEVALQQIPQGKSRLWHNALMDYGSLEKTARKTGIKPLSTQPTFEGSERQTRGKVVRALLQRKKLSMEELQELCDHPNLSSILEKMEKDELITNKENMFMIA